MTISSRLRTVLSPFLLLILIVSAPISGCGDDADPGAPLCEETWLNPQDMENPVDIHCRMESGDFADPVQEIPPVLQVVDWNIERGLRIDALIEVFHNDPQLSNADIVLIQEADRHCARTDYRDIARELAQALKMNYVYGVEFIELFQDRGEHGNAILSRFPIMDARVERLTDFERWYEDKKELRLGGRMVIRADILIGAQAIRFASVHMMSKPNREYFSGHDVQTEEVLGFLDGFPGPVIWGGDLNTFLYYYLGFEPCIRIILNDGYGDALANLPRLATITHPAEFPMPPARLDWIFYKGLPWDGGHVLRSPPLPHVSDHFGIYSDFSLNP